MELTAADVLLAIEYADVLRNNGFEIAVEDDNEPSSPTDCVNEPHRSLTRTSRVKLIALPVSKNVVFGTKGVICSGNIFLMLNHYLDLEELLHLLQDSPSPPVNSEGKKTRRMVRCAKARAMFASRACRKSVMIGTALKRSQMISVRT